MNGAATVFLFDVDNTLFDNDRFAADLSDRLRTDFGEAEHDRYWRLYGDLRDELGYADYLQTVQRFRTGLANHPELPRLAEYLLEYRFAEGLYPGALQVLSRLSARGVTAILSDGDMVFQPRKIRRSGIWDAVGGRVLIEVQKERELDALLARFPARAYVMVDDKPQILSSMKSRLGADLTTIFVRQGHYALAALQSDIAPPPDMTIDRIGDLLDSTLSTAEVTF